MRRFVSLIPITLLLLAGLSACGSKTSANQNKTLNVTLADEPATVDPNKDTDTNSASVIAQTMEGLYTYSKSNKIIPGVATKVVKPTNHGKTYTFTLKKTAKWANGQRVTAQDFVTSLRRMADPKRNTRASCPPLRITTPCSTVNSRRLNLASPHSVRLSFKFN